MSDWYQMVSIGDETRRNRAVANLAARGVKHEVKPNCGSLVIYVYEPLSEQDQQDIFGWSPPPTPEEREAAAQRHEDLQRRAALEWHLTGNFYPPLPISLVDAAIEAIDACSSGWIHEEIYLPDGILVNGKSVMRADEVVDWLRLETMVDYDAGEDW